MSWELDYICISIQSEVRNKRAMLCSSQSCFNHKVKNIPKEWILRKIKTVCHDLLVAPRSFFADEVLVLSWRLRPRNHNSRFIWWSLEKDLSQGHPPHHTVHCYQYATEGFACRKLISDGDLIFHHLLTNLRYWKMKDVARELKWREFTGLLKF